MGSYYHYHFNFQLSAFSFQFFDLFIFDVFLFDFDSYGNQRLFFSPVSFSYQGDAGNIESSMHIETVILEACTIP